MTKIKFFVLLFTFAIIFQTTITKITLNNPKFDEYLKEIWENEDFIEENGFENEYNITIGEWPWLSWGKGPNCPIRHHLQLVDIKNAPIIKIALENVKLIIEGIMTRLKSENIHAGVTISIVYGNEVLFAESFGQVNKSTNEKPNLDTIYNIGSVTKIFTSLALFQSISQGKTTLDTKVTKYFNENNSPIFNISNPYSNEGSDAITFQSLASQSSGLPRETYCGIYPLSIDCKDQNKAAQLNMNSLSKIGLLYSPFTGSHYSNLGLALLGRSLERIWGEKYEDYMSTNIFKPIGMNSTGFIYNKEIKDKMAVGYLIEGPNRNGTYYLIESSQNYEELSWSAPAGGLFTSTNDLIKFFQFIFDDSNQFSNIINKTALNSYLMPGMLLADGMSAYGSGSFETFYANKYWTLTKGGLAAAMAASVAIVPELKLGISTLINVNSGFQADKMNAKITRVIVPAIIIALNENQIPVALPSSYKNYLGNYGYSNSSVILHINETNLKSGILSGFVSGLGDVFFLWDSSQDYNGSTAFRYSSMQEGYESCMSLFGIGNNAIAYFSLENNLPVVTLADQNLSLYFIPKLD